MVKCLFWAIITKQYSTSGIPGSNIDNPNKDPQASSYLQSHFDNKYLTWWYFLAPPPVDIHRDLAPKVGHTTCLCWRRHLESNPIGPKCSTRGGGIFKLSWVRWTVVEMSSEKTWEMVGRWEKYWKHVKNITGKVPRRYDKRNVDCCNAPTTAKAKKCSGYDYDGTFNSSSKSNTNRTRIRCVLLLQNEIVIFEYFNPQTTDTMTNLFTSIPSYVTCHILPQQQTYSKPYWQNNLKTSHPSYQIFISRITSHPFPPADRWESQHTLASLRHSRPPGKNSPPSVLVAWRNVHALDLGNFRVRNKACHRWLVKWYVNAWFEWRVWMMCLYDFCMMFEWCLYEVWMMVTWK